MRNKLIPHIITNLDYEEWNSDELTNSIFHKQKSEEWEDDGVPHFSNQTRTL
jgi:hypothetical protein